jgi:hypothetical protein
VEAGLGLDHHRQVVRQVRNRLGLEQLPYERADRKADTEVTGVRSRRDDENVALELARIGVLAQLDA